ncbi:hypothetical protein, partial [Burkholderia ubonensis]|uniref:hypothetical protein n=1 Tax=Burkholderia ubonensis TaxID=101571 RepID=UPI001E2B9DFA
TRVSPASKFSNPSVTVCPVMQGQVQTSSGPDRSTYRPVRIPGATSTKAGIKIQRLKAATSDLYRTELLGW